MNNHSSYWFNLLVHMQLEYYDDNLRVPSRWFEHSVYVQGITALLRFLKTTAP